MWQTYATCAVFRGEPCVRPEIAVPPVVCSGIETNQADRMMAMNQETGWAVVRSGLKCGQGEHKVRPYAC